MRLALVSQEYPPETAHGGIATQTRAKAVGLAARGHDVTVVSASVDGTRSDRVVDGVRVIRIAPDPEPIPVTETDAWRARSEAVARELDALVAGPGLDLVDVPDYGAEGAAWLARRGPGGPAAVAHLHGPLGMLAATIGWPEPGTALHDEGIEMEGACLRAADLVYASGSASADWAARLYGLHRAEIPVLHTGVDTRRFRPTGPKAARPTVVFAGRVADSKGVGTLLEACLALAARIPGLELEIVGRGDAGRIEAMRARAAAAGRGGLLRLTGFVPRARLPERLSRGWVFAAPSRYEGGPGFAYLEAMACGLPVVACAGSGAADALAESGAATLVPLDDPGALAAALGSLLTDAAERERRGSAGRAWVRAHADGEACVADIEALYRRVVAGRLGAGRRGSAGSRAPAAAGARRGLA